MVRRIVFATTTRCGNCLRRVRFCRQRVPLFVASQFMQRRPLKTVLLPARAASLAQTSAEHRGNDACCAYRKPYLMTYCLTATPFPYPLFLRVFARLPFALSTSRDCACIYRHLVSAARHTVVAVRFLPLSTAAHIYTFHLCANSAGRANTISYLELRLQRRRACRTCGTSPRARRAKRILPGQHRRGHGTTNKPPRRLARRTSCRPTQALLRLQHVPSLSLRGCCGWGRRHNRCPRTLPTISTPRQPRRRLFLFNSARCLRYYEYARPLLRSTFTTTAPNYPLRVPSVQYIFLVLSPCPLPLFTLRHMPLLVPRFATTLLLRYSTTVYAFRRLQRAYLLKHFVPIIILRCHSVWFTAACDALHGPAGFRSWRSRQNAERHEPPRDVPYEEDLARLSTLPVPAVDENIGLTPQKTWPLLFSFIDVVIFMLLFKHVCNLLPQNNDITWMTLGYGY